MRVVIVSCVYPPEPVVSSRTSADVAGALNEDGESVSVICPFPSRPAGQVFPGFRRRWRSRSSEAGIDTVRCYSFVSKRSTIFSRFGENLSFGISSALTLLPRRGVDVVFLNSWPVFATGLVALVARLKGIPYVLSVQDVYPESLLSQGRAAARVLAPLLRWIDARVARGAAAVVVLSEAFAAIYRDDRRVDAARIHVVPNWSSEIRQASQDEAGEVRRRLGLDDEDFLVVYGGNVGVAAGVEQLVAAFRHVDDARIHLLVAGSGSRLEDCRVLADRVAPGRVHFLSPWPEEETAAVLAAADLLALPTAGEQSRYSVPSKLISYLLAERPILVAGHEDSELGRIARDSDACWISPPDDEATLAHSMQSAARTPRETRRAMGTKGRAYAQEHFSRDRCVGRIVGTLRSSIR